MTNITTIAHRVAERSEVAYSYDRYTNWTACARVLLTMGYTEAQAEAILRSKCTRWAADASDKPYGRSTSKDLQRFVESNRAWIDAEVDQWALYN